MLAYQSKITATPTIQGITPYSACRYHQEPMYENESYEAYDQRTYLSHLHVNSDGQVVIPSFAIHDCLVEAARYSGKKIKGARGKTWTQKLESGIAIFDDVLLLNEQGEAVTPADADFCDVYCHANGQRGSAKRVFRRYPIIYQWGATFDIHVLDPIITRDELHEFFGIAGLLIGLGRFRPQNRGKNGRFSLTDLTWREDRQLAKGA